MSLPAPLLSTQFASIQDFQSYFQKQDELSIAANQHLVIHKLPTFATEGIPENGLERLLCVINRTLIPFARSVRLIYLECQDLNVISTVRVKQNALAAKLKIPWSLKLEPKTNPLVTRLDHLVQMMAFSSVFKTAIAPSQPLILTDLTEDAAKRLENSHVKNSLCTLFELLLQAAISRGFKPSLKAFAGEQQIQLYKTDHQLRYTSTGLIEISLKKIRSYKNLDALFEEIAAKGELVIQDHEILRIHLASLQSVLADYKKYLAGCYISKLDFVLGHMSLLSAKEVTAKISGGASLGDNGENGLSIELNKGGSLSLALLEKKQMITSSKHIQEHLISLTQFREQMPNEIRMLTIVPNQELTLYGFKKAELLILFELGSSLQEGKEKTEERMESLFFKYSTHMGSQLHLPTFSHLAPTVSILKRDVEEFSTLLRLKGDEGFFLRLVFLKDPLDLAVQAINLSHPKLLQGLLDSEFNAMAQLLFRVLFHCCCEANDFGENRENAFMADKFKEATIQKIGALKGNEEFKAAYRAIQEDPALKTALEQIFKYTPDEFGDLDLSKLKPPLQQVIGELKKLEHIEFQGGQFLSSVIAFVIKNLKKEGSRLSNRLFHPFPRAVQHEEEEGKENAWS